MPHRAAPLRLVLTCLLLHAPAAARAQACAPAALYLEQQAAYPLPPHLGIEGATALVDGGYALWAADGTIFEVDPGGVRLERHLPRDLRPVGLTPVPGGFRFLDLRTGTEYQLGADTLPAVLGRVPLAPGQELDGARWVDDGWLLAVRDTLARRFLLRRVATGGAHTVYASSVADTVPRIPRYHLSPAGPALLLTHLTAPFEVLRVDPRTGGVDTLATPAADPAVRAALPDTLAGWRALPAVALDCGWLLTLTDLTSDQRLLLRYDAAGALARVTPLAVPFGLVAGRPAAATLLAARRAGAMELVWYAWRWDRDRD
ncbi:MAG: hypothetical protein IPO73_04110 [Gemmatimonadetes bacterium]|nr:hypothetical protein [Gemmatimonadota bacterium]